MTRKTEISPADILDLDAYEQKRTQVRQELAAIKALRRVPVGPHATFYFECYETMHYQIQEMLRAERGGEAQLTDELAAYNPLVPKGTDLVATVMFEIDNADERHRLLSQLGGVEDHIFLEVAGARIAARPERDLERTKESGKTSSVHFVHFDLTPQQITAFTAPGTRVLVGIEHPRYGHVAIVSEETRGELSRDLVSDSPPP